MAVTPDGQTIIMSETHSGQITSFSIDDGGGLFEKKTFASDLQLPDGLCLDAAGAVWIGSLFASEFLRVGDGGTVTHRVRVPTPYWALGTRANVGRSGPPHPLPARRRHRPGACPATRLAWLPLPRRCRHTWCWLPVRQLEQT
jgi:hypothetical protein